MRKLFFHRSLVVVATGAASLTLAACGGGEDEGLAQLAAARPIAQVSSAATAESTTAALQSGASVLAADAGAASQEPL